jgi:hypothetical protein
MFNRIRDFLRLQVDIKSKTFTLLIASVILFSAMFAFAPLDSYIVSASIESSLSTGSISSIGDVIIQDGGDGDLIFTSSSSSTPDSAPATSAATIKLLPGSSPHFFKCNVTPNDGSSTLPGTSDITSSATIAVTDKSPDTEILGKALFDITFTRPVINNPAGPDIIVSEIGDSPEPFRIAAIQDNNSESISAFKEYSGSSSGSLDSCGYNIFEAPIDLSDFNVTEGDSIGTLRIDNIGQPGCCVGADIGDIRIANLGVGRESVESTLSSPATVPESGITVTPMPDGPRSMSETEQQPQAADIVPSSPKIFNLIIGEKTYPINYAVIGGEISNMAARSTGLNITFTPSAAASATADPGSSTSELLLTIDLPRSLIDSKDTLQGKGSDKPFIVLSGSGQVIDTVLETEKNATSRTLFISFNNSQDNKGSLQIQGTKIALPSSVPPPPGGKTPPAPPTTPTTPPAPPTTPTTPPAPPTTPTTPPAPPTTTTTNYTTTG